MWKQIIKGALGGIGGGLSAAGNSPDTVNNVQDITSGIVKLTKKAVQTKSTSGADSKAEKENKE